VRLPVRVAQLLLVVYAVLLAVAVFSPSNHDQSQMVLWLGRVLHDRGVPVRWTTFSRLEVAMNAAIVAPLTFLAVAVKPSWSWRDWTAIGFLVSGGVELVQAVLLSGRHASFSDVVANTLGALLGAVLGRLVFRPRRR
jgi:VanZ family protein